MKPIIRKLFVESHVDGKLDPELFADKILLHCRDIASIHFWSTSPEDYDHGDIEDRAIERTAVQICGSITSLLDKS